MGSRAGSLARSALAAATALLSLGCPHRATTYLNPETDFSLIQRVAVLPLENLTQEPTAAEKVRQLLIIQLLASGAVEVVDTGEVGRGLQAAGVGRQSSPSTDEIRRLGQELKAQALMAGSVQEFAQGKGGGAPATSVALVFRLIETDTGQVVWSSSISHSGVGAMSRLFGVGGDSATDRARKLIDKALKSLIE